jgi:dipeptidyl aminopeptidase/acylaminoacyl peptidase
MRKFSSCIRLFAFATLGVGAVLPRASVAQPRPFNKQRVTYTNGALTLVGYIYKPDGPGPFPTLVWNHGSEPNPGGGPQFDSVAAIFVPAGYAVVAPMRRGHSDSQGTYIQDTIKATNERSGEAAAERLMVELMGSEQLGDQLAGLAYAKTLAFVDTNKLVVGGCSYGGIETLLAAERGAGFKAAMPISPAALSWRGHTVLQNRLIDAVRRIDMPVLLIQPPKDASLEPASVLGAEAKRLGKKSFTAKVYPPTMPDDQQVHCFGGAKGMHNWAKEALDFFGGVLRRESSSTRG